MFWRDGELYRFINDSYGENFKYLVDSGLWERLVGENLIVSHKEVEKYKIYKPDMLDFVSYPYEWSFSALKDAALLTLKIQKISLEHNMTLKDASAYNVQFFGTEPVFIDILSFEKHEEGKPWIAYKQFCQHFMAPLLLMSQGEPGLQSLLLGNIDGIPLDLASKLLPKRTFLNFSVLTHIHFNAAMQKSCRDKSLKNSSNIKLSRNAQVNLLTDMENLIKSLGLKGDKTPWADYYSIKNYDEDSFEHKKGLVREYLGYSDAEKVIDLGANTGIFSKIAGEAGKYVISCDMDFLAVENSYTQLKNENNKKILPLIIDLCAPSPAIGWFCRERASFFERMGRENTVMALALIHHLRISNNVPLNKIAEFFSEISGTLLIEFVPKRDSMTQKLLSAREDIFSDYYKNFFEQEFLKYFAIIKSSRIANSERFLYLMKRK